MITITRDCPSANSTIGILDLDGIFECYTIELPRGTVKPCCIPAATYRYKFAWSKHFQKMLPHILDVPGFTDVEIHIANYPEDIKGCCGVGQTRRTDFIGNSELALDALLLKLSLEGEITFVDVPEAT